MALGETAVSESAVDQQERKKAKIKFGSESLTSQIDNFPGCFPVKIINLTLQIDKINKSEIKFFGVKASGNQPTGQGVAAYHIENLSHKKGIIAWFRIDDLITANQFTPQTKEMIIKINGREIGRQQTPQYT